MSAWASLRHRDLKWALVALLCSSSATAGQSIAIGKLAYDISGRKLALGIIGLLEFLPAAFLALISGHLADRRDRRRIVVLGFLGELACTVALAAVALKGHTMGPIYAVAFAFGVSRAFAAPSFRSLIPSTVPPDELHHVASLNSLGWQSASIAGPILTGFAYAVRAWCAFALAAVLFVVAIAAILQVRARPAAAEAEPLTWASVGEGFQLVRRSQILLGAMTLDLFAVLFGGAVALLPVYADDILHVGPVGLGLLRAAPGIGAAITGLALAQRPINRHIGPTLFTVVGLFGVFTIVFALSRTMWLSMAALAALAAADMVSVYIRGTLVPLVTPDALRGRVTAVEAVFIGGSNELGAFESGTAAQLIGTVPSVVLGGVATIVIAVGFMALFPALRRIDRFPSPA